MVVLLILIHSCQNGHAEKYARISIVGNTHYFTASIFSTVSVRAEDVSTAPLKIRMNDLMQL